MLFNSIHFVLFLPVVFTFYWLLKEHLKFQNILLLLASYFFYGCWDYRFLSLLIVSTLVDYLGGIKIHHAPIPKIKFLWTCGIISLQLMVLGVFKYYNFFASSFETALQFLHIQVNFVTLQVILPLGISFYTFHGLSYIIDIYKNRIKPETNFITYSIFVVFFPLLVAGPIERATHLLPQIQQKRIFDYTKIVDGFRQILWGFFKKIVIADNCAKFANIIFDPSSDYTGSTYLLGGLFFAFQIYGDFSGYSDIAIGTARLFGIELLQNFAFPYFSRDIAEFWRRWHISLSSWFRDYLYIPLGGSQGSVWMKIRNIFIIFIVSGFWHGAKWTFIVWGFLNALFMLPSILLNTHRTHLEIVAKGNDLPTFKECVSILTTFSLTVFCWIFFRAENMRDAMKYISKIGSSSILKMPYLPEMGTTKPIIILIFMFLAIEWLGREQKYALAKVGLSYPRPIRWAFYYLLIMFILSFAKGEQKFIYFDF
jgi:alginate O-acetyltransferase complex protein AlgI